MRGLGSSSAASFLDGLFAGRILRHGAGAWHMQGLCRGFGCRDWGLVQPCVEGSVQNWMCIFMVFIYGKKL